MIRKKLCRNVTEPEIPLPDLSDEEKRRYYVALVVWFLLIIVWLAIGLLIGIVVAFAVANGVDAVWLGGAEAVWRFSGETEQARQDNGLGLLLMLAFGLIGFLVGQLSWHFLFIRSRYLSTANMHRLFSNRAPTAKSENVRIAVGYVIYLLLCFGLGIPLVILGDRTPVQVAAAIVLNGLGIYYVIHAFLRYRKMDRGQSG